MWTRKLWRAVLIGLALALALAAVASAAPKEKPPKPQPAAKACADMGDGTAWVHGAWNADGYYEVTVDPAKGYVIPACIDLDDVRDGQSRDADGHLVEETSWLVTLTADVGKRPRGDVMVRLERAIHADIYAEQLMPDAATALKEGTVTLVATLTAPATEDLVFVAMPAHRMNWNVTALTVTPVVP